MAKDRINRDELADKLVERAAEAEDPLRTMAELITGFLMEAEVTNQVGAEAHERSEQRTTHRNGYRDRRWDTRLGTLQLQVPKVREGGYVPSFIEHRKRSEQALISVIQEAVVKGVSTRKIEAVLEELGIAGVSAGQVSQLCAALDEKVRKFREGPLGEIRYVWVDALYEKVRVDDRVESMAVVIATGANLQGRREVLGFDVIAAESEEGWAEFFKGLKERGLQRREAGDLGRAHGIEKRGAQGVEGGMAALQSALLSQRAGARAQAQPGRSERSHEGGIRAARREERQNESGRSSAAISVALRQGDGDFRGRHRRRAELFALSAAAPRADQFDQSTGAAKSGDPAPHPCGGHLPQSRRVPAADRHVAGGEKRRLAHRR